MKCFELLKYPSAFIILLIVGSAQSQTIKYNYDELGRLTVVEDNQNSNRNYFYDAAGNRTLVALGTITTPAKPTGLSYSLIADCAWRSNWNAVPSATSYIFISTQGTQTTVTDLTYTFGCPAGNSSSNKPYWVRACNATGCGEKAYF